MEKEIKLTGLTKQHVDLLDTMWHKGDSHDYEKWKKSLPKAKRQMADTLETMMIMEVQEEDLGRTLSQAQAVIAKMMIDK